MERKHALRAEKTKKAILKAASHLFAKRSFEDVTMRDIAKLAGCSHTAIYIYFKDKEELLNRLAAEPLREVIRRLELILAEQTASADERLFRLSREFVRFSLDNRAMYSVFFSARPTRVDDEHPALEVQSLRNAVFNLVGAALGAALEVDVDEDRLLACTRAYFFLLHGIVASYATSPEGVDALFDRLGTTFDLAFTSMLAGLKCNMKTSGV